LDQAGARRKETKMSRPTLNALRPLLDSRPRCVIVWTGLERDNGKRRCVCEACGAFHREPLYIKHKPGCSHAAHYRAIEVLRKLLEPTKGKQK
jgi:hypothetical protein